MAAEDEESTCYEAVIQVSGIMRALHEQRKISRFCDVVLKVCDEEIYAHSNVLAAASPYFGSFLGQGQDLPRAFSQKMPQIIEIHIDGSDGDVGYGRAVKKVVDFMYTSTIELSFGVLTQVMEIAKIMQMDNIIEFCENFQKESVDSSSGQAAAFSDAGTAASEGAETDPSAVRTFPEMNEVNLVQTSNSSDPGESGKGVSTSAAAEINDGLGPGCDDRRGVGSEKVKLESSASGEDEIEVESEYDSSDEYMPPTAVRKKVVSTLTMTTRSSLRIRLGKQRKRRKTRRKFTTNYKKRMKLEKPDKRRIKRKISKDLSEYSCEDCNYITRNYYHFKRHQQIHRTGKYNCDKCNFKASKLKALNDHKRSHLHAENLCSYCNYKAKNTEDLKSHLSRHTGPQPYFCYHCDMKFKTKTQLSLHSPKHSTEKPFSCSICNTGFKWKHALKSHMIVHSNSKDHLCDVCGFATAHQSQLKAHKLIHTGETFKCTVDGCPFQALKRQNLKYHMLTHTHEKPHKCKVCGQTFSLIKNMKRHMLLHSNDRPYKCDHCRFSSTRYDKLKEHLLKQHGLGDPPSRKRRISDYQTQMDKVMQLAQNSDNSTVSTTATTQIVIATPDDLPVPIAITRVNSDGFTEISYPTIQYVTQ